MNKRPNQSAVKSGPRLGNRRVSHRDETIQCSREESCINQENSLSRLRIQAPASSPRDVTSGVLLFVRAQVTEDGQSCYYFHHAQVGASPEGQFSPGGTLFAPPTPTPPTVSRIGGRYQQCAEAIYGGEEIYINQAADGGHALRKLRRGVCPPRPPG